ncbi:hypothetical protein HanRHA438_Chr12g0539291 [Helianthus annuus]|nr:hypothetical protein HanRHA438_Chr12g0539291 [Helianthus annuus]
MVIFMLFKLQIPRTICKYLLNSKSNTFNFLVSTTSSLWIIGKHMQFSELIIEVWTIYETSLGWTRYTPRIFYLLFVMLLVETMLLFSF